MFFMYGFGNNYVCECIYIDMYMGVCVFAMYM